MSLNWDFSTLADRVAAVLGKIEGELRLEQAVYGIDSRDELELHAILSAGLSEWYEVAREVHYPSTLGRKLSHRPRCDLVLTPLGQPLKLDKVESSLFDATNLCSPVDALWLEVKVAHQYREGGQRHSGYGAQWQSAIVADLVKMEAEPLIREAGLLLLVFTESKEILDKDMELFESILARKEVLAGFRQVRSVEILERNEHRLASVAVWPTLQR